MAVVTARYYKENVFNTSRTDRQLNLRVSCSKMDILGFMLSFVAEWMTPESRVDSRLGFFQASRPAVRPTQPPAVTRGSVPDGIATES